MGMLVLSRKTDDVIVVGDDIRIMVVAIQGDKVRIGIDAPRNVPIHREEVWVSIKQQVASEQVPRL